MPRGSPNPRVPERLWTISRALQARGLRRAANFVKRVNTTIFHNSLSPEAIVGPGVRLGHHSHGVMIHSNVTIGRNVKIWHNVTIQLPVSKRSPHRIVIEDDVLIGAHTVILAPKGHSVTVGRGARIGAGALVIADVPAGATVVSEPSRLVSRGEAEQWEEAAD